MSDAERIDELEASRKMLSESLARAEKQALASRIALEAIERLAQQALRLYEPQEGAK